MLQTSSVQFSHSVVSDCLRPHGLQHARLPCPSPAPGACLNSCPSSGWCYPNISSSVVPVSSCFQFFPASGSFPRSQFFASGGQSISASASASVLPMNVQDWSPLGLTGLISLQRFSQPFLGFIINTKSSYISLIYFFKTYWPPTICHGASQVVLVKNPPANAGDVRDVGLIPGKIPPGEGHDYPLQYSCLENTMDRGAWWATVHRVKKSWTRLKQLSMHVL